MITLNPAQHAAVTAGDGPALVLAGAGSGKTRVIVERLAWLAEERGIDPRYLLAVTFTNRAAAEMRERFAARLGVERVAAWIGTFHSFGLFVLRREMERLGRKSAFTVFDDADQLSLMKRLVKDLPAHKQQISPRDALSWISAIKQRAEEPEPLPSPAPLEEEVCRELWTRYHAALARAEAVDFDDLLVLLVRLLRDHADVREKYQRRFRHVLIDEYQDTNHAQYLIARFLSEGHGNLFVVGDEDQSIYSWRGADISNILDFADDFPSAQVHRLEQNYRSTKPILDAANGVVSNNTSRLGKTLWTEQKSGEPVGYFHAETGEEEARFVADDIAKRGIAPAAAAVLYRTNAQSRLFEEAFALRGIACRVVGGLKFYARKEIKDILAYLRLLVNPADDESLRRIINIPARGIGGVSLQRFEEYAALRRQPLLDVLRESESDDTIPAAARRSAAELVHLIDDLSLKQKSEKLAAVAEELLDKTGYRAFIERSDEKDFRSRLDNVDEFLTACRQHDRRGGEGLLAFLQEQALLTDIDTADLSVPAVTLMTCHNAKGLEFDHVYLAGLEEGLLPLMRGFDDGGDLEEERRLCYVAMTRARVRLTLTAARIREIYGRTEHRTLSRFIDEAGRDRLQHLHAKTAPKSPRRSEAVSGPAPAPVKPPPDAPAGAPAFRTGMRVRHASFGKGTVSYTAGSGDRLNVHVRFDTGRLVKLRAAQAPLEILEGKTR